MDLSIEYSIALTPSNPQYGIISQHKVICDPPAAQTRVQYNYVQIFAHYALEHCSKSNPIML